MVHPSPPSNAREPVRQDRPTTNNQSADNLFTHIKLHIYPDGGVARLRVYGEVQRDWSRVKSSEVVDLAAAQNGALAIQCNDMFFSHMNNLIMPGRGVNMGDGWETKRNRTPNNRDWVIVRLAHKGIIRKALIGLPLQGQLPGYVHTWKEHRSSTRTVDQQGRPASRKRSPEERPMDHHHRTHQTPGR
ncbi:MAG: hypothetical protein R2815_08845 [Flavobacteriales bacterium]